MQSGGRIAWIDDARGIGIALVVVGHVLRGLIAASILPDSPPVAFGDAWIYAFHMPLFFFLSGMFGPRNLDRPTRPFLQRELRSIAYPYLVWSVLQAGIQIVLAGHTNHAASVSDLLRIPWVPVMQFWFLYALFLIVLFVHALRRLGLSYPQVALVTLVLEVATRFVSLGSWGVLYEAVHNAPYFAFGAALGPALLSRAPTLRPGRAFAAASLGFAALAACIFAGLGPAGLVGYALASLGIASALSLAIGLGRERWLEGIRTLGVHSLPIFVAHTLGSAFARIALRALFGVESAAVHLVAGVSAGLLLPVALAVACERLGFRYGFTWPAGSEVSGSRVRELGPGGAQRT